MQKVSFHPLYFMVIDHLLTIVQHYEERHHFECAECGHVFKTKWARTTVFAYCSTTEGYLGLMVV